MPGRIGFLRRPQRFFNVTAPFYEWLVHNDLWRASVREMARHLPPSGAALRVIDVGCGSANSARFLAQLRPDVQALGVDASPVMLRRAAQAIAAEGMGGQVRVALADAAHLPAAAGSADAVFLHSVYYMLDDQPAFLAEALRVLRPGGRLIMLDPARPMPGPRALFANVRAAPSLLVWQAVSRAYRRYTPTGIAQELTAAGFARVLGERAVGGFGVLSRGEKPYPLRAGSAVARMAEDAPPDSIGNARYLFLLIREAPHKPAWERTPDDVITWGAACALDRASGGPVALAFTSLPKAVAFMQPAVTAGRITGVTRVAKFQVSARDGWGFPLLVNPAPGLLSEPDPPYTLPGPFVGIDPVGAVTGEE